MNMIMNMTINLLELGIKVEKGSNKYLKLKLIKKCKKILTCHKNTI